MTACHAHNLRTPATETVLTYGVRVSLLPADPFRKLLGDDWNRTHWYASAT